MYLCSVAQELHYDACVWNVAKCRGLWFFFFMVLIFLNWKCSDNNLQKVRKKYPRVRGVIWMVKFALLLGFARF